MQNDVRSRVENLLTFEKDQKILQPTLRTTIDWFRFLDIL